ncbi:DUF2218 domain-containing protein [Pseudomonas japonica]|uniref:DUF2218 domain-containing protein n=1 Tax=Pseudomonas japonica TaxID=256466 RepID=A0A239LDZ4_9PSED|nr:DUF2218 domain-containing protein [Pseudomonas japonica]SNT28063.1 hypothetical protein SAMN05444352_13448 [Pseudomonas japonica]
MLYSQATTPAAQPQRLINRLSRHWAHKFQVEQEDGRSRIDFDGSGCLLKVVDAGLWVEAWAPAEEMDELEVVIVDHLQRNAVAGETLSFAWQRRS